VVSAVTFIYLQLPLLSQLHLLLGGQHVWPNFQLIGPADFLTLTVTRKVTSTDDHL
jgi:hypothetical protein